MILAIKSASSEVSGRGKKMSTTSFESSIIGGDTLSTPMKRTLPKDKFEALGMCFETIFKLSGFVLCLTCR